MQMRARGKSHTKETLELMVVLLYILGVAVVTGDLVALGTSWMTITIKIQDLLQLSSQQTYLRCIVQPAFLPYHLPISIIAWRRGFTLSVCTLLKYFLQMTIHIAVLAGEFLIFTYR